MKQVQPDRQRRALMLSATALTMSAFGMAWTTSAKANELEIGHPAPVLVLHTLDGRKISTADLLGKVVIVTFWASYCEPCRDELPLLSAYAQQHARSGLEVLGFCIDPSENLEEVRNVAKSLYFPVGLLGTPYAGGYGRIWRMPVSFVIDRAGKLVDNGWKDENPVWTSERLHRIMDPLLR
jgi:thiol-disulfide isomerase/thioredoxin